jgi:hypothetical protein
MVLLFLLLFAGWALVSETHRRDGKGKERQLESMNDVVVGSHVQFQFQPGPLALNRVEVAMNLGGELAPKCKVKTKLYCTSFCLQGVSR